MTLAALPLFHAVAGRPVIVLGEGAAAEAKRRLVERAGGTVAGEDNREARLAFVALNDPEAAAARLRDRGVLVNVPDRPDLCDFTVPGIVDRSPVLLAIGTGGASAGLAKALRLRLEAILPQSLGALAAALGKARGRLRARYPDADARRLALDAALGEGGALDPFGDNPASRLDAWLTGGEQGEAAGLVEIRLTSGDPEDLTLRQARLLGSAGAIAFDPDVPPAILDRARADAARIALVKGEVPDSPAGLTVVLRGPAQNGSD